MMSETGKEERTSGPKGRTIFAGLSGSKARTDLTLPPEMTFPASKVAPKPLRRTSH
jgi:hypothetical protein